MNEKQLTNKESLIWMAIGGIVGALLGIAAFYDSWID